MKNYLRYISFVLTLAILLTSIPLDTFAAGTNSTVASQDLSALMKQEVIPEANIIGEVTEKRDKATKHFLKDDMSYESVVYPMPIHYQKDGKWADIDNTLVEKKDEQNIDVLENKENDYKVKVSKNTSSKNLVRIQKGKYELAWNIIDAAKTQVKVKADDSVLLKSLNQNEQKKTLTKLTSTVDYTNIFENVDLQYILYPMGVKENIILQKPVENPVFKLSINIKNLEAKLNEDKTISFYDPKAPSEEIFTMAAPYMVDAKDEISEDIKLELVKDKNGYILTITPDKTWLSDASRQYPVIIDPKVETDQATGSIDDTHTTSAWPNDNFYMSDRLYVGNKSTSGINRAFIKFDLPILTAADMVIDAKLKLQTRSTNPAQYQVNAHEVTQNWQSSTLKWSDNLTFSGTIEDFQLVQNMGAYSWNITSLAKKWYTTNANYGVMLKNNNENIVGSTEFYSSDLDQSLAAKRPIVEINYVNNAGLESYWTYHSMDIGRAGTAHVNDYNGNFVLVHNDIETTGSRMPIAINHVFNNNYRSINKGYGQAWRLNIQQTIEKQTISGIIYYVYTDEDGTKHYYEFDPQKPLEVISAESGIDLKLTISSTTVLTLEDNAYNKMSFSTIGADTNNFYLKTITDKNANAMTIAYQGTNPNLVTDGAGRKTLLAYDVAGILQTITDATSRVTRFGYTGINLTTITYPDTKVTRYDYTASGNITDATNYEGYKMSLEYHLYKPYRVKAIKESNADGTLGQKISMEYGNNSTIFSDIEGRKNTFQFNNSGNTNSVRDQNGNVGNYDYGSNVGTDKNKLTLETKLHSTKKNYLKNHNAEFSNTWTSINGNGSLGTTVYEPNERYLGAQSLKIYKSNEQGFHNWEQKVLLTKGNTYILSAYIKTIDVSKTSNKGARLYISYLNNAGQTVIVEAEYLNGVNDWTRLEKFFTLPLDASSAEVTVGGTLSEEKGTAYFDCFQLEDGKVASSYNLVENANFTYGTAVPDSWVAEYFDANDGVTTDAGTHPIGLDNKVLKITGAGTLSKKVVQSMSLSGIKGDKFFLGGWAKGNAAYSNGSSVYKISLEIKNSSGAKYYHALFNEDTPDWQYTSNTVVAESDYTSIRVFVIYYNNANSAMFDGIQLFRENGYQYNYTNGNGNVTKYTNPDGNPADYLYSGNDLTSSTDENGNKTTYGYDQYDEYPNDPPKDLDKVTSAENIVTNYSYDFYGNIKGTLINEGALKIESSSTYDASIGTQYKGSNYLSTTTDPSGNKVTYNYDWTKGILNSFKDAVGNTTSYQYDSMDRLNEVSTTVSGIPVANTYGYTDQSGNSTDSLQTIGHNGFNYKFQYDKLGNLAGVDVGSRNLVTNTYANYTDGTGAIYNTSRLNQVQYGNGQKVGFNYDSLDRVTGKSINSVKRFNYDYDENGNIGLITDERDQSMTRFLYNPSERLTGISDTFGNKTNFIYDNVGNVKNVNETINGNNFSTAYNYNMDYSPKNITFNNGGSVLEYNYKEPVTQKYTGRLFDKILRVNADEKFRTTYTYEAGTSTGLITNRLAAITNKDAAIAYTYDKNGNIKTITEAGKTISYYYNELNELVRENNLVTGNTVLYSYDAGGNITNKKIYPYTTETVPVGTPQTVPYTYGDSEWKDLLTNYNGNTLTYDEIGNLLNDGTYTYTWEEGRQLASMSKVGQDISFKYNTDGIRTEKTVNDKTTTYHLVGDKVTFETNGTDKIYYTYDASDNLVSMNLNGTEYYYIRNGQNDIIGLLDYTGTQVVSYTYDTWGELVNIDGTLKDTVGVKNPYRYRGYRYDNETGLYYLQSRYYNPDIGRFVNVDATIGTPGTLLNHNIFAYCINNPVNLFDPAGFGDWFDLGNGWKYRYDEANTTTKEQSHVHVKQNGTKGEWSQNADGSKHKKSSNDGSPSSAAKKSLKKKKAGTGTKKQKSIKKNKIPRIKRLWIIQKRLLLLLLWL